MASFIALFGAGRLASSERGTVTHGLAKSPLEVLGVLPK